MARDNIPVVTILREGVAFGDFTPIDFVRGAYFLQPEGGVELMFVNVSGAPRTVTFETALVVDDLEVEDLDCILPAGGSTLHGGFRRKSFNQDFTDGSVFINASGDGVLARAFRFEDAG